MKRARAKGSAILISLSPPDRRRDSGLWTNRAGHRMKPASVRSPPCDVVMHAKRQLIQIVHPPRSLAVHSPYIDVYINIYAP